MADRPIIFSAPMVRAMLDGRKTQTRRVLRLPDMPSPERWAPLTIGGAGVIDSRGHPVPRQSAMAHGKTGRVVLAPHTPGDRLWVREAIDRASVPGDVHYRTDYVGPSEGLGWRPSIHMPRWASRLTLTVTAVRVQRLQDISEEDARAEGVTPIVDHGVGRDDLHYVAFGHLWDRLHGPGAWDVNPWVVAVTFSAGRHNIDATP
jgi:hypothetical protein